MTAELIHVGTRNTLAAIRHINYSLIQIKNGYEMTITLNSLEDQLLQLAKFR